MLVLAIWLFLLGYVIAWTGKMNLGVSYKPQSDGSIKAVDDKGNPAKTYSLMDAITCAQPSGSPSGTTGIGESRTRDQFTRNVQQAIQPHAQAVLPPGLTTNPGTPGTFQTMPAPGIPSHSVVGDFLGDIKRGFCSWTRLCKP